MQGPGCACTAVGPGGLQRGQGLGIPAWSGAALGLRSQCPADPMALSPDCEAPLKKEGSLPEGPVLEALLCAETGEKKMELKEEEAILDCQVGPAWLCPTHQLLAQKLPGVAPSLHNQTPPFFLKKILI